MNTQKATRAISLVALAHLIIELCNNYLPVVYPILIEKMSLNYTQIGAIALVGTAAGSIVQPLFGYLSDRWDPHRLTALSVLWIGILMGLVGFAPNYPLLLLLVGLGALGSAAFHPSGASVAMTSTGEHKGAAASVFSVGGNVGAALSPLLLTLGLGALGLRGTAILLPIALLAGLLIYVYLPPSAHADVDDSGHDAGPHTGFLVGLLLVMLAVMARSWFQLSFVTYLPVWIENQGQSVAAGGRMLFLFSIFVGAGSLSGGPLSDRVGRWQVVAVSLALLSLIHWLFIGGTDLIQTRSMQALLIAAMGFCTGASFPVAIVMAQESWPRSIGVAAGMVIGLGWLPGGLGASATGLIADQFSLRTGLQTLILPPLLGTVAVLVFALLNANRSRMPVTHANAD